MGVIARVLKSRPQTLASATTLTLPDDTDNIMLTGTTTIVTLRNAMNGIIPGRVINFTRAASADKPKFTNTPGTSTSGQMDIGGSTDTTVSLEDELSFRQQANGTWRLVDLVGS